MKQDREKYVLIADDQQEVRDLLVRKLRARGKEVLDFPSGSALLERLGQAEGEVELVVLDLDFGSGEPDGVEVLARIKETLPELPVIILTGKGSVDTAVNAVQNGAADFIEKDYYVEDKLDISMEKVERMLQVLRENARLKEENEALGRDNAFYRSELGRRYRIVSASPGIEALLEQIERIASIPRPVLIRGERGYGKGADCGGAALRRRAPRPSIRQAELCGSLGYPAGVGALRPRKGRIHGGCGDAPGPLRERGRRHLVPRRDRQHLG